MVNRVIALGFFDGVHLGHAALLKKTVALAAQYGATPAVLTFNIHPGKLTGKGNVKLINTAQEKKTLIEHLFGIEDVIMRDFDEELMRMPWQEFINRTVSELGAVHFVVGYDYRFGFKGEGTAEKLSSFAKELGIGVDIVAPVEIDGQAVSSTAIRGYIASGDMAKAREMLGHPHYIGSRVEAGERLGRKLGVPTINQHFSEDTQIPAFGVYASKVCISGKEYISVTNVGIRPTVTDASIPKAETHIVDYDGDLYGREIYTELYEFIREEQKFSSVSQLKEQMEKDVETVKNCFAH